MVYFDNANVTATLSDVEVIHASNSVEVLTFANQIDMSVDLEGGNDSITLAAAGNTLTAIDVETINGSSGADKIVLGAVYAGGYFDGGADTDVVDFNSAAATLTIANIESITGASGADVITAATALSGIEIDLGASNDSLTLAVGGSNFSVTNIETVVGSSGIDTIILTAADQITVSLVENITGSSGKDDVVIVGTATGLTVDLDGDDDQITFDGTGNVTATLSNVETIIGGASSENLTILTQ